MPKDAGQFRKTRNAEKWARIAEAGLVEIARLDLLYGIFRCKCGNEKIMRRYDVLGGGCRSCGCLKDKGIGDRMRTHGMSRSSIYSMYRMMIRRCEDESVISYPNYGGRGIRVCPRWKNFNNFLEDMGDRPQGMTLDRIDNNGDYCPGNCRWATRKEQGANKRNSTSKRIYQYNGTILAHREWASLLGITSGHLNKRIRQLGIPAALMKPNRYERK